MLIRPAVEGIDSDYGIGEVLAKPLFPAISLALHEHKALDRFVAVLNRVAWDSGATGG